MLDLTEPTKGKGRKLGFGSPTNCQQLKPSTPCIWKQIARPSTSKDGTNWWKAQGKPAIPVWLGESRKNSRNSMPVSHSTHTTLGVASANRHEHTTSWCIAPLSTLSGSDTGLSHHHESHRTIRVMAFCVNAVFHARWMTVTSLSPSRRERPPWRWHGRWRMTT